MGGVVSIMGGWKVFKAFLYRWERGANPVIL